MTVSSNPGELTTTTTTTKVDDIPTSLLENTNTSGKTMRRRIEQGLPNQGNYPICTNWDGRRFDQSATDLMERDQTEIQEVKKLITAIPHEEIQRNFSNLAILLDERMTNLEDQYEELKKMVKQNSTQNYSSKSSTTRALESWRYGHQTQPMDNCKIGFKQSSL